MVRQVAGTGTAEIWPTGRLTCTIRPNFTTKLNSDSRTRVCISNVSERNGEADTE